MDVCDPGAEREAAVARERPGLAGCGYVKGDCTGEDEYQEKNA